MNVGHPLLKQAKNFRDPHRDGVLGMPDVHAHDHHPRNYRAGNTLSEQFKRAAEDVFTTDHHSMSVEFIRYAVLGSILGIYTGGVYNMVFQPVDHFGMSKEQSYLNMKSMGYVRVGIGMARPWLVGGALSGAAFYGFYHLVWANKEYSQEYSTMMSGYGALGGLIGASIHLRYILPFTFAGAFIGKLLFEGNREPFWGFEGENRETHFRDLSREQHFFNRNSWTGFRGSWAAF